MVDQQEQVSTFEIDESLGGLRLDVAVARLLPDVSRTQVQSRLRVGAILLNGEVCKPSLPVSLGDLVEVRLPPSVPSRLKPAPLDLNILFEDDDLLVIDKPPGLVVHPGAGEHGTTLAEGLLYYLQNNGPLPGTGDRPGIVHRLDKDTSGVIVCAKTSRAHAGLAKQFQEKTNHRSYVALVDGVLPAGECDVESYLYRDPINRLRFASMPSDLVAERFAGAEPPAGWRWAKSHFQVESIYNERLSRVRVTLHTGRTHQIRVHAAVLGAPIVGDLVYHQRTQLPHTFPAPTRALIAGIERQMLHAETLGFEHPLTGQPLRFQAPLPADFAAVLAALQPFAG